MVNHYGVLIKLSALKSGLILFDNLTRDEAERAALKEKNGYVIDTETGLVAKPIREGSMNSFEEFEGVEKSRCRTCNRIHIGCDYLNV